jgi:hypothetical protein
VGHLAFLVAITRPDLSFTLSELSKFVQYPGAVHMKAAERALQYVKGTLDAGITYTDLGDTRRNVLEGWVDSDYASDPDTRRSVTGFVMSLNGGPVSWRARRQACVTGFFSSM